MVIPKNKRYFRNYEHNGKPEEISGGYWGGTVCNRSVKNISFTHSRILYLLKGKGIYQDSFGTYDLSPGDMVFRTANVPHNLIRSPDEEWLEFAIVFPSYITEFFFNSGLVSKERIFFSPGLSAVINKLISEFLSLLESPDIINNAESVLKAQEIFLHMLKISKNSFEPPKGKSDIMIRAEYYLSKDLHENISLKKIAGKLGMGYESFRKKFKEESGNSPRDYRIQQRLRGAESLLLNHELQIQEIASQLGYYDPASFVRQFQKYNGCSPSQFRTQRKK